MLLKVMMYVDDPGMGGNAVYAHHLAIALADAGVQVVYVHFPYNADAVRQREEHGVRHVHLPYDTIRQHFHAILDRQVPQRILIDERPDVVLFSDSVPQSTVAAKEVAAALGIPVIAVKHLVLADNAWARAEQSRILVDRSLAASSQVLTVSRENAQTLYQLFTVDPTRLHTVYNSVPAAFFAPRDDEARRVLRAEWGAGDDTMVVFTTARVLPQKGYDLQAKVLERLVRGGQLDGFLFVWAGEAETNVWDTVQEALEGCGAQGHVRMLGRRTDISRCLDAADTFFLPSRGEGMPLSVIEAMAKGVPVIATAVSGIPEAIGDTGGLLPDPNADADAMVDAAVSTLVKWKNDPAKRVALGQAAGRRATALFRPERQLADMVTLIAAALKTPGDYVSPGLLPVRPDRYLPYIHVFDVSILRKNDSRAGNRHLTYVDARRPHVVLPNRDEGALIHNTALRVRGKRMLLLNCGIGWTLAHVRAAGGRLDIIDPLMGDEVVRDTVAGVLQALDTGPSCYSANVPGNIPVVREMDPQPWSLALADADTFGGSTLAVLQNVMPHMAGDAFVLVTGAVRPEAGPALDWLAAAGWSVRVYDTARALAVAWRGTVTPVEHQPDPDVDWDRPPHLTSYFLQDEAPS